MSHRPAPEFKGDTRVPARTIVRVTTSDELFARASNVIPGGVEAPLRHSARWAARRDSSTTVRARSSGCRRRLIRGLRPMVVHCCSGMRALRSSRRRRPPPRADSSARPRRSRSSSPNGSSMPLGIDMVRLVSSGTEATMSAIRLARGATGRDVLVKFEGCSTVTPTRCWPRARLGGGDARHPPGRRRHRRSGEGHRAVQRPRRRSSIFAERGADVAVVIVEPIAANMGVVPPQRLPRRATRALRRARRAALFRRGNKTGFRYGGAVALRRDPDLTTLGKSQWAAGSRAPRTAGRDGTAGAYRSRLPGGHTDGNFVAVAAGIAR